MIEVGCGSGATFRHYPREVTAVLAVEPDAEVHAAARAAAAAAPVPVEVVSGVAEALPAANASFDAAISAWVLCTVRDPHAALAEIRRVLRPGGELRFYEHVRADRRPLRLLQRACDVTWWPAALGGCHVARDTEATIRAAGFAVERLERLHHASSLLTMPSAPHVLGSARR